MAQRVPLTSNLEASDSENEGSFDSELNGDSGLPNRKGWSKLLPIRPVRRRRSFPSHWPWIFSTVTLSAICVLLLSSIFNSNSARSNTYEGGFDTDLDAAIPALDIVRKPFTGGLHWDENGTLVRNALPNGSQEWVGPPSPELDALWDHVVDAAGVDLVGKEAAMVKGKTRQRPSGEYISGLDVFHQLHCLNKIRQAFYPNYYPDSDGPVIAVLHVDHCIDYIRQAIMCNSDMAFVRVVYSPSANRWSPNFERAHTCRDFQKLLDWSLVRLHPGEEEWERQHGHESDTL